MKRQVSEVGVRVRGPLVTKIVANELFDSFDNGVGQVAFVEDFTNAYGICEEGSATLPRCHSSVLDKL